MLTAFSAGQETIRTIRRLCSQRNLICLGTQSVCNFEAAGSLQEQKLLAQQVAVKELMLPLIYITAVMSAVIAAIRTISFTL